jgi:hypothetical protein
MHQKLPFTLICTTFLFILFLGMPTSHSTYAKSNDSTNGIGKYADKASLRNTKTNERIELPVKKYKAKDPSVMYYEVFIPSSVLANESHTHWDSTAGVSLTITQYYNEHLVYPYSVSLTSSSAKWMKTDNTISITNAYVQSIVYGYPEGGGGLVQGGETNTIGTPSLNTWYYQYPSWSGTYIIINGLAYQESRAGSLLVRGGSSWELAFCVAQGGGDVILCE